MKNILRHFLLFTIIMTFACAGVFLMLPASVNSESFVAEAESEISEDTLRTFSTNPDSYNVITRYGNTKSYFKNAYSNLYETTDRQCTGIAAMSGDTITVYVEAEENDPLPSICFTQYISYWRNWMKVETLKIGKNVFTVPEFGYYNDATTYYYKEKQSATLYHGGPIYLINQYTESQQSSNVKITISGGECFPLFRDGGDEKVYKAQLKAYVEKVNTEPDKYLDVTEIDMKHNIMTVWATRCYNEAYSGNVSVQVNVNLWNDYMERLFTFNGVEFDKDSQYYNELIQHVRINIRQAQNSNNGALYATSEYIGWCWNAGVSCFNFNYNNDITHEIGHIIDVNKRNINEVTNEVVCEWGNYIYVGGQDDSKAIIGIFETCTNETVLSKNWYKYQTYGIYKMLWFLPCGSDVTLWGKFNNLYYREETGQNLGYVEKMVYYWSLASGADSSEYFERCGFYYSGDPTFNSASSRFTYEKTSETFKTLMNSAKASGRIGEIKKWWYYNVTQFNLIHDYGENISSWASLYTSASAPQIKDIIKSSNGYTLILPEPTNKTAHLGYEILEYNGGNWSVIGFSYDTRFEDTTTYEDGYLPTYKIRAYDRALNCTKTSNEKSSSDYHSEYVCRIGQTYYTSLSDAVASAESGSTIYIFKDIDVSNITINKNLTILADCPVTITKLSPGNMFTITSGTVTFGNSDNLLTFDGGGFTQSGSIISCSSGTTNLNNVKLCNNKNSGNGGAVEISKSSTRLNISDCEIYNNSASYGGGIYNDGSTITITNTKVYSNTASSYAGGLGNFNGGVLNVSNSTIKNNVAVYGGGVSSNANGTITNCNIEGNSATYGGGIYLNPSRYNRTLNISGGSITDNIATKGGSLAYVAESSTLLSTLKFVNTSTILKGEILKTTNAVINLSAGILDLSNVTFAFTSLPETATVATCANLTEEQLDSFKVSYIGQLSKSGNNVIFSFTGVKLTVKYSYTSNVGTLYMQANENYVLPDVLAGMEKNVYITEYRTIDGNIYQIGDTVNVNEVNNCLIAVVSEKCRVTVTYADHTETLYVKSGESLNLGTLRNDSEVSKWEVDGKTEEIDSTIQITNNTYVSAIYPSDPSNNLSSSTWWIILIICILLVIVVLILVFWMHKRHNSKSNKKRS